MSKRRSLRLWWFGLALLCLAATVSFGFCAAGEEDGSADEQAVRDEVQALNEAAQAEASGERSGPDKPDEFYALIDVSGSQKAETFAGLKQSLLHSLAGLREQDRLVAVAYAEGVQLILDGSETREEARGIIENLTQETGSTASALYDALKFANEMIAEADDKEDEEEYDRSIIRISPFITDWHNNLLKEEHGAKGKLKENGKVPKAKETVFGQDGWIRKNITAVYVLDTLLDMPDNAVDISAAGDGSVMGWVDDAQRLYIAGEGGVMAPENSAALFAWLENATVIDLGGNLHTENTTDMRHLFYHCYNLETLNLAGMDTSHVTTMAKMFVECHKLRTIDLSGFNTENVERFYQTFYKCDGLEQLDISSFNTAHAETFAMMFGKCRNLREIISDPAGFTSPYVRSMSSMFAECEQLINVDTSRLTTNAVKSTRYMFKNCYHLQPINVDGFLLSGDVDMEGMFVGSSLENMYGPSGEYLSGGLLLQ